MKNFLFGWYVLYVKRYREKRINVHLKEAELDSFLPISTTLHQWSDRKKKIVVSLFPNYFFKMSLCLGLDALWNQ